MKKRTAAIMVLVAMFGLFIATMFYAAAELSDHVASHFDWRGQPNGWMSKEGDLIFLGIVGFGVPLFIIWVCYMTRYLPKGLVNLPHKDYWLAPERRAETSRYVFEHSLWFASMLGAFLSGVHLLAVFANQQATPRLSNSLLLCGMVCFLAGTGVWIWRMFQHFRDPRAAP